MLCDETKLFDITAAAKESGFKKWPEEEIRYVYDDNLKIFLSNLHKDLCCGCSLGSPW